VHARGPGRPPSRSLRPHVAAGWPQRIHQGIPREVAAPLQLRLPHILLALLLHFPAVSIAQAAVFHRLASPPRLATEGSGLPRASLMTVDRDGLAAFRA